MFVCMCACVCAGMCDVYGVLAVHEWLLLGYCVCVCISVCIRVSVMYFAL